MTLDARIAYAVKFWDETEELIKKSEHINNAMLVPAITELRYAGRKLVDYLHAKMNVPDKKVASGHLDDFSQCCIRARHDAIDGIVTYISEYIEKLEEDVGSDIVDEEFPLRAEFIFAVEQAESRLRLSRRERYKRTELYSEVNEKFVGELIETFNKLRVSTKIIYEKKRKTDRQHRIAVWGIIFGILGLVGTAISVVSLYLQINP